MIRDLESPLLVTERCVWLPQLILSLVKNSSFQITNKYPVLQTVFKDWFTHTFKFCHCFLTLMLFQMCVRLTFFSLWNTTYSLLLMQSYHVASENLACCLCLFRSIVTAGNKKSKFFKISHTFATTMTVSK